MYYADVPLRNCSLIRSLLSLLTTPVIICCEAVARSWHASD